MEKQSKAVSGTMTKRLLILKEEPRMLSVAPAINYVEILFKTSNHSFIVNSWEFETAKEAREKYDRISFSVPAPQKTKRNTNTVVSDAEFEDTIEFDTPPTKPIQITDAEFE